MYPTEEKNALCVIRNIETQQLVYYYKPHGMDVRKALFFTPEKAQAEIDAYFDKPQNYKVEVII